MIIIKTTNIKVAAATPRRGATGLRCYVRYYVTLVIVIIIIVIIVILVNIQITIK